MSRSNRKTWTLMDLKLNYWRGIADRQAKNKPPSGDDMSDKKQQGPRNAFVRIWKFISYMYKTHSLVKAIAHYTVALLMITLTLFIFGWALTGIFSPSQIGKWSASHEAVRNFGLASAAILAAAAGLVGLIYSKERTDTEKAQHELDIKREQNQRYLEAIKLLASNDDEQRTTRMGALYALAALAEERTDDHNAGPYYVQVVDTLAAYVRDRAPYIEQINEDGTKKPPPPVNPHAKPANDIATAVEMISRLNPKGRYYKLSKRFIDLSRVTLDHLSLNNGQLSHCDLSSSLLREAMMIEADMSGADMSETNMSGADMSRADMSWANMSGANMSGADMSRADMSWAYMRGADMSGAHMSNCTALEQEQIDIITYITDQPPALPEGLILPPQGAIDP